MRLIGKLMLGMTVNHLFCYYYYFALVNALITYIKMCTYQNVLEKTDFPNS